MLQVTGHGKDVFNMSYQSAITEFINKEKQCIKRWEMKYKPMFEKKWREHKKRYLNKPQRVGRTIGRLGSTSEPTFRCIGWGISPKFDKRTADKEIARGGLSHYKDGEEYYNQSSDFKRSVHGRTKALSTAFYDTNGIYSFGGDVITKQGSEIDKGHEREMLRIENLRRRMGMYDSEIGSAQGEEDKENEGQKEGEEEEAIEPSLSDVSEPIEDLDEPLEEEVEPKSEMKPEEKKVPVVVPELQMDKVRESQSGSRRSSRRTTGRSSRRSTGRKVSSARSQEGEKTKNESVFQRARRAKKGRKKQKISAFNSYGNPLYPRFSSHSPRSEAGSTASSTCSSARRKKKKKKGKATPRHDAIMRRLEARMEKKKYSK